MTVQELIDWLQGLSDPDGVAGVDPNAATVRVALLEPSGEACLLLEAMTKEQLLLPVDPTPLTISET